MNDWEKIISIFIIYASGLCLIENESGSDTKKINPYPAIGGTHPSGFKSYGLFQVSQTDLMKKKLNEIFAFEQINSKNYCRSGYSGGLCNVKCEGSLILFDGLVRDLFAFNDWFFHPDMMGDNISKAAMCAQMIFRLHGFKVWYGWERKCKSHQDKLPSISDCVMAFVE